MDNPKAYFESKFECADPWNFATSEYELKKYERQVALIEDRTETVDRILEIGCAEGVHSRMLLEAFPQATLLGIELSDTAAETARSRLPNDRAEIVSADAIDYLSDVTGDFDTVVWSETIYYMADRMTGPDLYEYVETLFGLLRPDGVLVMANFPDQTDAPEKRLTRPALMDAYRRVLSGVGTQVHRSQHTAQKVESNATYTYEIRAFEP